MRSSVKNSVFDTIKDLHKNGIVNDITMKEVESLCLPELKPFSARAIVKLRHKLRLSQAAFARILNISVSTVQKWELGAKHPSGLALKLLNLAERKGLEGIA